MLPKINNILYATDLGPRAFDTFRQALGLAQKYGARIHIIHVVEPLSANARHMVDLYAHGKAHPELEHKYQESIQQSLSDKIRKMSDEEISRSMTGPDLIAGIRVVEGKPAEIILEEREKVAADLIVIGSHGHSAIGEIILGTTAHKVVQKSPVSVLLVRSGQATA